SKGELLRADSEADGWTMLYHRGAVDSEGHSLEQFANKYAARVSRKSLNVECGSTELATREQADRVIAICNTLQAAAGGDAAAPKKHGGRHKHHAAPAPSTFEISVRDKDGGSYTASLAVDGPEGTHELTRKLDSDGNAAVRFPRDFGLKPAAGEHTWRA